MKRVLIIIFLVVFYLALANMQGCSSYEMSDNPVIETTLAAKTTPEVATSGPENAVKEIFFQSEIMGLHDLDETVLQERFDISPELYTEYYGKYADGRYGVSDIFILRPAEGREAELKEALEQVKIARINEFQNYNIYNALENAEDALIFNRGDYMVMVMTNDAEGVKELIGKYLPEAADA